MAIGNRPGPAPHDRRKSPSIILVSVSLGPPAWEQEFAFHVGVGFEHGLMEARVCPRGGSLLVLEIQASRTVCSSSRRCER